MEASASVTIKPMVSGELTEVAFREGQDVNEGGAARRPCTRLASLLPGTGPLWRISVRIMSGISKLAKEGMVSQEQADGYRSRAKDDRAHSFSERG